jgi:putative transposase
MARPPRIEYEGAFYHVFARGNERRKVFLSKADYEKFLDYLKEAALRFSVIIHAYALMGNHYHLIVETPKANLSSFMHSVQSGYTTYFNRKRNRSGHLFQGRYKSILIDKDAYLLELSRYVHLNPIRAHMAETPEGYPFSSYPSFIDPRRETLVSRDLILGMSHGPEGYRRFVESGLAEEGSPFRDVYGGMVLGRKSFIKDVLRRLKDIDGKEAPFKNTLRASIVEIDTIVALVAARFKISGETVRRASPYRNYAVYLSKKHTASSNREIGAHFGNVTFSAVAKIVSRLTVRMKEERQTRKEVEGLERKLAEDST